MVLSWFLSGGGCLGESVMSVPSAPGLLGRFRSRLFQRDGLRLVARDRCFVCRFIDRGGRMVGEHRDPRVVPFRLQVIREVLSRVVYG